MIYFIGMKPGKEEIPELGIMREIEPMTHESLHHKNVEQAVEYFEEFANSFRPMTNERDVRTNIEYRTRAAEEFRAKAKEKIKETQLSRQTSRQAAENTKLLFSCHALITQEIVRENRNIGSAVDKKHQSHLTEQEYRARLIETIEFQQKMTRFILQHKNIPGLDAVMQRYWTAFQTISSRLVADSDFSGKQERGIEHAVTASHLLEQRGWRTHRPSAKEDMQDGTDAYASGITPDDKQLFLALQFKPRAHGAAPVISVDVLYPFPLQSETKQDAWALIAHVKKLRSEKPNLLLFPVLVNVPSYRETPFVRRGTGLLASHMPADILDKNSIHALEYAETLADAPTASKPKKRRIIYDAQAK